MIMKKQAIVALSIVTIAFLLGTVTMTAMGGGWREYQALWEAIFGIQEELEDLQSQMACKNVTVTNWPEEQNVTVTNWPEMNGEQNVTVTNFPLDEEGNLRVSERAFTYDFGKYYDIAPSGIEMFNVNTSGYRQISLAFYAYDDTFEVRILWYLSGVFNVPYETFTVPKATHVLKTYDVIGKGIIVNLENVGSSNSDLMYDWYVTS